MYALRLQSDPEIIISYSQNHNITKDTLSLAWKRNASNLVKSLKFNSKWSPGTENCKIAFNQEDSLKYINIELSDFMLSSDLTKKKTAYTAEFVNSTYLENYNHIVSLTSITALFYHISDVCYDFLMFQAYRISFFKWPGDKNICL